MRLTGTKDGATAAVDYTWLLRTAENVAKTELENVAKTELTPPAGYTQQAAPQAQAKIGN